MKTPTPNTSKTNPSGKFPVSSPRLSPAGAVSEVQSALTLVDFFQTWYHLRYWFVIGFILVSAATFIWNKYFRTEYFRAETRIFVGRNILPEQRVGIADLEIPPIGRNDQFINVVNANLAEQLLTSNKLLLEVVDGLRSGEFKKYGKQTWDLFEMLKIKEKDDDFRHRKLADILRFGLVQVRQIQNSGLLSFSVELPNAQAAREFANSCIQVLQDRFADIEFGYYDQAKKLYQERLSKESKRSENLAQSRVDIDLDHYPTRDQQNEIIKAELEEQARWIAQLNVKIGKLDLATTSETKAAGNPLKVIDPAYTPIKKSRPHVTLNTLLAAALYTFVFMLGLAAFGYVRWSMAAGRRERD